MAFFLLSLSLIQLFPLIQTSPPIPLLLPVPTVYLPAFCMVYLIGLIPVLKEKESGRVYALLNSSKHLFRYHYCVQPFKKVFKLESFY